MAQGNGQSDGRADQLPGVVRSIQSAASKNPATERLVQEATDYLGAQLNRLMSGAGGRVGELTRKLTDVAEGKADAAGPLGRAAMGVMQGENPVKAMTKAGAKGVGEKVKSAMPGGKDGGGKAAPSGGKYNTIIEDLNIGVPLRVAYDEWTKFSQFPEWAKGAQKVDQDEETETKWSAKIAWSVRNWTSTITEQVPDRRIAWKSEGSQAVIHGVVSFHPLGENLTRILVTLQYYPSGFFEKTANLWRAQGRRVRLDLKLFRRYVMMGEADPDVEPWRGEIRDGEVVKNHDEAVAEERDQDQDQGAEEQGGEEDEDYDEDEEGDEEEDEEGDEGEEGDEDEDEDEEYDEGEEDEAEEERPARPRQPQHQR
ncbi:MAG TPA: SRPBCC family protein [Mycobacteriales bacterium]|nr:SRPBCC family protein [Mycobacteriales bacterium]